MGVKVKDILPTNGAQTHAKALADAKAIFDKSGIVVAHSAGDDKRMLTGIDFSDYVIRDTQECEEYRQLNGGQAPGLAMLASSVLGRTIQVEEHSSVEDARATMDLFLLHREEYEVGLDYAGEPLESDTSAVVSGLPNTSPLNATQCAASNDTKLAPGALVAWPGIKTMAKGRVFDIKTSTYF